MRRSGTLVCVALIVLSAANLLTSFVITAAPWNAYLAFMAPDAGARPWSFLTYPIAVDLGGGYGFLSVVFSCWWLYFIGGEVERDLGHARFGIFWGLMTIIPALVMWAAMLIIGVMIPLIFMFLPLSGVTVAWCTRNPNSVINIMLVIPIKAKWLGWLTAGFVLFGYGFGHPMLGVFACLHLFIAWAYAMNRIPGLAYGKAVFTRKREGWKPIEKNDTYFADVKRREIERAERERLRKLFEGSLNDDPEDKR